MGLTRRPLDLTPQVLLGLAMMFPSSLSRLKERETRGKAAVHARYSE